MLKPRGTRPNDYHHALTSFVFCRSCRCLLQFVCEAAVLSRLNHPNIVYFYGILAEQQQTAADDSMSANSRHKVSKELSVSLVLERCGTSLDSLLDEPLPLPLPMVLSIAFRIAAGLLYLHKGSRLQVVHGDLKPGNVLVTGGGLDAANQRLPVEAVKLTDFGLSQTIAASTRSMICSGLLKNSPGSSAAGTQIWAAPELLEARDLCKPAEKTPASDIYAFGMVLYQMLVGEAPFSANKDMGPHNFINAVVEKNRRPVWGGWKNTRAFEASTDVLGSLEKLVERCWNADPGERPSAQELFNELASCKRLVTELRV